MRRSNSRLASSASGGNGNGYFTQRLFPVLWEIAPWSEIQKLDFGFPRMIIDLGEAGIIDFEKRGFPQRQIQKNGEDHADNAAVAKDGDCLASVLVENFPQAGFDPGAKGFAAFRVFDRGVLQLVQPIKGADFVLLQHLIPAQARPAAKVHLPQILDNDRRRLSDAANEGPSVC